MHLYQDLIHIFNQCFSDTYNTRLIKGGDEPIYIPASTEQKYNALCFAHGFYSSALHETAHWLIAGEKRRTLVDFGYWYNPDGRTAEEQDLFFKVEVKPQALEWVLSHAAGYPFRISVDNLNGESSDTQHFKQAVHNQVREYCVQGLAKRASIFRSALCSFYKRPLELNVEEFTLDSL